MMKTIARGLYGSFAVLALAPAPGFAADTTATADNSGFELEEIVITAQRRTESTQKASIIVDVLSADALRSAGVTQVTDLTNALPGVQVGMGGAAAQIYIRGVGDIGSTAISNPAVAFNVDGIYIARPQDITGHFYDVARVEVLKGPQGTLYGRNASGGAINLITNAPKLGTTEANVNVEIGNYNARNADGALNLPIGDTVALRAAFQAVGRDGYLSDGADDDRHQAGRLQLLFKPSEGFSALIGGDYSHVGGKGPGSVPIPPLAGTDAWTGLTDPRVNAYLQTLLPSPPGGVPGFPPGSRLFNILDGNKQFIDNTFWGVHANVNVDLGFANLTIIPAYRKGELKSQTFPGFDYYDGFAHPETSKATSLETRLSHDSDRLKWVAGLFYFNEDQDTNYKLTGGLINNLVVDADLSSRNYAAFGQVTYGVTDALRLIGGLRYTSDKRTIDGSATNIPFYFPSPVCPNPAAVCLVETYAGDETFTSTTWKAGAEFDLTPQNMLFFTASTGFKGGGFNAGLSDTSVTRADKYEPEKLLAFEFGSRNRFMDNRLQVNLELFHWTYDDHQEPVFIIDSLGVPQFRFVNAGSARQYGADIDVVLRPTANDTFHIGGEYLNSRYNEFKFTSLASFMTPGSTGCKVQPTFGPFASVDCSGFELSRAPKVTGMASYSHRFELGSAGALDAELSANYVSARWLATDFTPAERAPSYVTENFNITYTPTSQMWSVGAFVRNISDEEAYTGASGSPYQRGFSYGTIAAPRTYGARASLKF